MTYPLPVGRMTVEQYMEFEDHNELRDEYVDGLVHMMSGATRRHNLIAGNVYMRLRTAARGGPCRVHHLDVKLMLPRAIYYPDAMVACGEEPNDERIEVEPSLLVEVLSASTYRVDLGEKLVMYKDIPSLHAYLVIEQSRRWVDHFWRDADGTWQSDVLEKQGTIPIPCTGLRAGSLTLDEVYEGVQFPTPYGQLRVREQEAIYYRER